MPGNVERVLAALNATQVRYLIVGGVAVVLHGHLRTTADLDLIVDLETSNITRAITTLTELGFHPRAPVAAAGLADAAIRQDWIANKGMTVFSLWNQQMPGFEVDIFAESPLDFEAASARAIRASLDTTHADVVALEDLIALTRAAGRPQDLEDVAALEALRDVGDDDEAHRG